MSHSHNHNHSHDSSRNISFAFWLNTFFALVEVAGGIFTNSIAILSDALHDFGDSLSLGLAWYFQKKSKQASDSKFSYGYKRFSLLGAFINATVLLVGSIFIIIAAIGRLTHPTQPDAKGMLVLAIFGIAVNGIALLRLKKGDSINERVVSLHFLEDVLGWVAVLIGSVVMMVADVPILDPILSILIAGFILFNVWKNVKSVLRIILQASPENVNEKTIRERVLTISGVKDIHDVHTWSLDGQYNILTLHVVVKSGNTSRDIQQLKNEVRACLKNLHLQHITIEMELEGEECAQNELVAD